MLILSATIVFFKILPKNAKIRYFWSQFLCFLVLHKTLHFDKFESTDFKYDNIFLACYPKHANKAVSVPNLSIFNIARKFDFPCYFKCDNKFFPNASLKIPISGNVDPNFKCFILLSLHEMFILFTM